MCKRLPFLGAGAALACAALLTREPIVVERNIHDRPVQMPADGYISSETCRSCHPSQYASWHASYHRTMAEVATPGTVATSFDGVRVTEVPGRPMFLERRDAQLWAELDDPDWDGTGGLGSIRRSERSRFTGKRQTQTRPNSASPAKRATVRAVSTRGSIAVLSGATGFI